jgi:CBS domain-containing protein/ribosome-associated translation inhibitor RaiA
MLIVKMMVKELMTKEVYSLSKEDTLSKAISLMTEKRFHQLPIVNREYEGMIFLKELIKAKGNPTKTKVENFLKNTPVLREGMNSEEAIRTLAESGLRALPVVEDEKVVGILSETDVILNLKKARFKEIKAAEIMNKVIVASENDKLKTVLRIMQRNNISSVPLIDWKEEISGCINLFSIARFLCKEKERIESFRSAKEREDIFKNPAKNFAFFPQIAEKEESLEKVINLLEKGEEVVIIEGKKPIGIIKPRDIIESLVVKEKMPIVVSGVEKEKALGFFERVSEKWKKLGVQRIIVQIEKIGAREKYDGKIKVMGKRTLIASSQAFDVLSLLRELREKIEKEMEKERGKLEKEMREKIRMKGE